MDPVHHHLRVRIGRIQELHGVPVGVVPPVLPVLDDAVQGHLELPVLLDDGDQFLRRAVALLGLQEAVLPERVHRRPAGQGADVPHHRVAAAAAQEEIRAVLSGLRREGNPLLAALELRRGVIVPIDGVSLHGMEERDGDLHVDILQMIVLPPLVQAAAPVLAQAVDGLARLQQEALVNLLVGDRLRLLLQQQRPVRTVEGIDRFHRIQLHPERLGGQADDPAVQGFQVKTDLPGRHRDGGRRRGVHLAVQGGFHHLDDLRGIADDLETGGGPVGPEAVGRLADRPGAAAQQQGRRGSDIQTVFHIPQFLSGWSPITNTSFPPLTTSSWLRNGRVSGSPFKVADWMYLLSSDAPWAIRPIRA